MIAFGGGGNTFYVSHGGTNFGYSGDTATTSYDYRAPLGEASQLRQGYFAVRRADVLRARLRGAAGELAGRRQRGHRVGRAQDLRAQVPERRHRRVPGQPGTGSVQTQVKLSSPALQFPAGSTQITVAAERDPAVVASAPWTANATFAYLATNVLGKLTHRHARPTTSATAAPASPARSPCSTRTRRATAPASPWTWDATTKLARATFTYPTGDTITELPLDSGDGSSAIFLVVNSPLADRTWLTDQALYVGATYVNDDLGLEVPAAGGKVVVYSADGRTDVSVPAATAPQAPTIGQLAMARRRGRGGAELRRLDLGLVSPAPALRRLQLPERLRLVSGQVHRGIGGQRDGQHRRGARVGDGVRQRHAE